MLNLRERLESWDLVPEETEKDGNCFFRAVSRMVYGSDQYHHYIRQRAVETLSLSIEEYQPFFLHEYDSPEAYLAHMRQDNSWADDAAVRATVEALEIEIQIISAENDYIPILTPSNTVPSQTIFIGLVQDFHFVSTSDRSQPQYVQQGGVTSDGIILEYTECVDNPLTWLFELFTKSNQLFDKRLETPPCSRLRNLMSRLRSGNSADGKKELAEWIRRKKYVYQTEKISFKSNTDEEIIEKILRNSKLNDLEWQVTYNACPNEECECGTSLQRHSFSRLTLKDMENMKKTFSKYCPSCQRCLTGQSDLIVASPFILIQPGVVDMQLDAYPREIKLAYDGRELLYTMSYVGLKNRIPKHKTSHYTSYFKSNENYWYRFEPLNSTPIRRLVSLPGDIIIGAISCLVFLCSSMINVTEDEEAVKKHTRVKGKKPRAVKIMKKIEVVSKLKQTSYVQLVNIEQLAPYREFDRNKQGDPGKRKNYLKRLTDTLLSEGLYYPATLAVSKKTGKAYVYEGNHRLAALINTGTKWVPVVITYYFIRDTHDPTLNYIPLHNEVDCRYHDWPSYPTPEAMGFISKNLPS